MRQLTSQEAALQTLKRMAVSTGSVALSMLAGAGTFRIG
jgi:hypothetical protein